VRGEREGEGGREGEREGKEGLRYYENQLTNQPCIIGHTHSTVVIVPGHGDDPSTAGTMAINAARLMVVPRYHIAVSISHINAQRALLLQNILAYQELASSKKNCYSQSCPSNLYWYKGFL
jgi:hypothetical protein